MNKKTLITISGILLALILISSGIFIIKNRKGEEKIIPSYVKPENQKQQEERSSLILSEEEKRQFGLIDQAEAPILTQSEKEQYNITSENRVHFMTDEEKMRYNIKITEPVPIEMVGGGENYIGPLPKIYLPEGALDSTPIITEKTDSDNDGLTDIEELKLYDTDINNFDTDGDGISDFDEIKSMN